MKTIAVDIDDVIAGSTDQLRLEVNELVGSSLTKEDYSEPGEYWGYYERVWEAHGIEDKVTFESLNTNMAKDQSHMPLLPGAAFALSELSKNYKLLIVTSRDSAWENATKKWILSHFGDIFSDVLFTLHRKDSNYKTKGDLCKQHGASWLIDDNVEHCASANDVGVTTLLFGEYGWHHVAPKDQIKCKDWQAVLEYFNGIKV